MEFRPHAKKNDDKTSAWFYFLQSIDSAFGKCKQCGKVIKCSGGSTSSLHTHLKSVHKIKVADSVVSRVSSNSGQVGEPGEPAPKKKKMTDFFSSYYDMENMICRMVALDGMSFQLFVRSDDMRYLFLKSGHTLPKSATTIKNIVMKKGSSLKDHIKVTLTEMKQKNEKFPLTFDEWTSSRSHRYLNVNIHGSFKDNVTFKNIGLIRIFGSMPASTCIEMINDLLLIYSISFDDIAAITTDGASVMVKVGRDLPCFHQLCLAHGLQLAILDVFFNEKQCVVMQQESEDTQFGDTADRFDVTLVISDDVIHNLTTSIKDLITKVRKVVKLFKNSPTKNDTFLQKYVFEEQGKNMALVLDCNTRWSSMADMLDRFLKLKECVLKSLIDIKSDIQFLDTDFDILSDINVCLHIAKMTVEALCRRDANLITADTAINFMLSKLKEQRGSFSNKFAEQVAFRIKQRSTCLTSVLKYLQNPSDYYANKNESVTAPSLDSQEIAEVVNKLQRLGHSNRSNCPEISQCNSRNEANIASTSSTTSITLTPKTMAEELQDAIEKAMSNPKSGRMSAVEPEFVDDLLSVIKVEMALYDNGGVMGKNLLQVYNSLLKVPPTSVESERVFSSSGYLCNHLRTSLNDDTLDVLSMLRSHYQSVKKN